MYRPLTSDLSRRHFLQNSLATGVMAAGAGAWPGISLAQETPSKGGTLKIGSRHGSSTDTVDPAHLENGFQTALTRAFSDTLTEVDADGNLIGSLATSWEASADAKEWTFNLRQGVEFHNGKSFKAEDVIASLNYHRSEDSTSSVRPLIDPVKEIIQLDDHTIRFVLESGNADFPFNLDTPGFMILPADADGSINWRAGIGTGGYILEEYKPGTSATLNRNPNYWNPDRAHADRVELYTIADSTARSNALLTGTVQVIDQVALKTADRLASIAGITVEETSGPLHYTFAMLTKQAPFDDVNVRKALKHALNRQELLDKVLQGRGTIGNDNPIGPSYRYHASDIEQNSYDPDKAKHYLKKSGLSELEVNLSAAEAAFAGAVDASTLYQARAADASIKINVVREPNDGYWSEVWLKKPFSAVYWGGYATEDTMFTTGYHPTSSWNDTNWDHEKFNTLLLEARGELNEDLRREMYRDMQIILRDEGGTVVPLFANNVMARNAEVGHGKLSAASSLDGARVAERWWVNA